MQEACTQMGSEQSHPTNGTTSRSIHGRPNTATGGSATRLQRGNTIAVTERRASSAHDDPRSTATYPDSRPVSPPTSVCSDSDLPYVSYTDKPIGGKFIDRRSAAIEHRLFLCEFIIPQIHQNFATKHKIQSGSIEMRSLVPPKNPF